MGFVGIQMGFGSTGRRQSLRKTWFPSDREGLRRLEASTGLAFRFVIGWTGDQRKMAFLFKKKLKNMMSFCCWISKNNTAISHTKPFALFDTDFYVKADDDIYLRPDEGKPVDDGSKESLPAVHVAQVPESGKNSGKVSNYSTGTNKQGGLPENFFDSKGGSDDLVSDNVVHMQIKQANRALPVDFFENTGRSEADHLNQLIKSSKSVGSGAESKPVKGVLPEGFFDNRDSDLHAHGIEPVKVDIELMLLMFGKRLSHWSNRLTGNK